MINTKKNHQVKQRGICIHLGVLERVSLNLKCIVDRHVLQSYSKFFFTKVAQSAHNILVVYVRKSIRSIANMVFYMN